MTDKTAATAVKLPESGTPLCPAAEYESWRSDGVARPLIYKDGHIGHIGVDYQFALEVLQHVGFVMMPRRMPESENPSYAKVEEDFAPDALEAFKTVDLLALSGETHLSARRLILPKLNVKTVKALQPLVATLVEQLLNELPLDSDFDLTHEYSEPISFATHALLLGFEEPYISEYRAIYSMPDQPLAHYDFARRLRAHKLTNLGDDLLSHLYQSELTPSEQEAITFVLLSSGRDSVAYFITTSVLALLKNPEQMRLFIEEFESLPGAIDELVRYGTMFLTLFPRTAATDIEVCGYQIKAGESVSVSAVAANRDPAKFENPDLLDLSRQVAGHIGFGQGAHSCIGQQYARMILGLAIPGLLRHFSKLSLVGAEQDSPMPFAHAIATYKAGKLVLRAEK